MIELKELYFEKKTTWDSNSSLLSLEINKQLSDDNCLLISGRLFFFQNIVLSVVALSLVGFLNWNDHPFSNRRFPCGKRMIIPIEKNMLLIDISVALYTGTANPKYSRTWNTTIHICSKIMNRASVLNQMIPSEQRSISSAWLEWIQHWSVKFSKRKLITKYKLRRSTFLLLLNLYFVDWTERTIFWKENNLGLQL